MLPSHRYSVIRDILIERYFIFSQNSQIKNLETEINIVESRADRINNTSSDGIDLTEIDKPY